MTSPVVTTGGNGCTGIFDRLLKGGGEQRPSGGGLDKAALEVTPTAPRRSFVEAGIRLDRSSFFDVLSACLALSTAVQEARAEIIGDLAWNGTAYEWQGNRIVAHFPHELTVDFDEHWRIVRLATT